MPPADIFHGLEPYRWYEWATERHMYDTPDITYLDWGRSPYSLPPREHEATELMRLGMLHRIYGDYRLNAQEN
jgi:hypothetical protein